MKFQARFYSVITAVSAKRFAESNAFSHWNLAAYCSLVTIVLPEGAVILKTNLPALFAVTVTLSAARLFFIAVMPFLSPISDV